MSEVLTGLVGIVVGGVLTGAIDQWGSWRARKRNMGTAARLVLADAIDCGGMLEAALEKGEWWSTAIQPATKEWWQSRQDLATTMSPSDLDTVQNAFRYVTILEARHQAGDRFLPLRKSILATVAALYEAAGALMHLTRTSREMRRWFKEHGIDIEAEVRREVDRLLKIEADEGEDDDDARASRSL
jgi:hypothetical protein